MKIQPMSKYQIQQFNKIKGEQRTKSLLVDRFLVDKPDYDLIGADLVVAEIPVSEDEWNERISTGEVRALVQAKYVQDENTGHYIKHRYVLDKDGSPKNNFFLFVHSTNSNGDHKKYFFTAREIFDNLPKKVNGFYFRIGKEDNHKKFSQLSNKEILDKFSKTYKGSSIEETQEFVATAFSEVTLDELYRVEGELPNYLRLEGVLSELGGGSWEGLSFRNEVLKTAGWDVNKNYGESPEEAVMILNKINRCIPKIRGLTKRKRKESILNLVSSEYF